MGRRREGEEKNEEGETERQREGCGGSGRGRDGEGGVRGAWQRQGDDFPAVRGPITVHRKGLAFLHCFNSFLLL